MSAAAHAPSPPSRLLMMLEARAIHEYGAFVAAMPFLSRAPKGDGHPVLVLPGLATSDHTTVPLRRFLTGRGYAVSGWEQGRNYGLRHGVEQRMVEHVQRLADRHGRKVSLVGWSLGGLYARQLAKALPDQVRSVITLGSPFAGHPKSTNAWRVYEFVSGQSVDDAEAHAMGSPLHEAPPVPTTAVYSRTDGVCHWTTCVEKAGPMSESIEVEASHCGLGHHPAVVYAIADRLAQPEGSWKPFDRKGWRAFVYREPHRP